MKLRDVRRTKTETEAPQDQMYPFGESLPEPEEDEEADEQVDVKALMAKVTDLQANMDRLSRENTALLTRAPVVETTVPDNGGPLFDASGLPDPLQDPTAYNSALQERINNAVRAGVDNLQAKQRQETTERNQIDSLWSDFAAAYPDLAEKSKLVEFAAAQVVQEAQARGLDAQSYVFRTRERYFDDVASYIEENFGLAADADEERQPPASRKSRRKSASEPAERTAGIFDGSYRGSFGSKGDDAEAEAMARSGYGRKGTLTHDLMTVQRKLGLY